MALHHFTAAQQVLPRLARFYSFDVSNKVFTAAEKSWALDLLICCFALFYLERWRTKNYCTICARKTHSWNSQNHNFHDWQQKQSPVIFGYKLHVAWCILAIKDNFFNFNSQAEMIIFMGLAYQPCSCWVDRHLPVKVVWMKLEVEDLAVWRSYL